MRTWRTAVTLALVLAAPHTGTLAVPACASPAVAPAGIRLNEILAGPARDWDGSGAFSSRDDEWIEIANTGVTAVDLAGFYLTDADSIPRYAFSGTLGPGETRLVTGKASYDWEKATGQPAFGLSLGNTGDAAMLWFTDGVDTLLVDAYAYKSHEAAADRSVGRSTDTGEWQLFDALDPYTGTLTPAGNGCAPTPGAPNTCAPAPAHTSTWGALKAAYR
jgi:hypothetical protein